MEFINFLAQTSTQLSPSEEEAMQNLVAGFMAIWAAMGIGMIVLWLVMIVLVIAMLVFRIYLQFRILKKAGYSPWLALLHVVPIGSLILNIILAFSEWPLEREAKSKK